MNQSSINVWVGNYDNYKIPDDVFQSVRMTKRGFPDKRNLVKYNEFMAWVDKQEKKAR